jgi:hypothetical protein
LDCDFEAETNKEVLNLKRIVSVHGGVPGSSKSHSKSLDTFWTSSSDLELLRMKCSREFKDQGVEVSTTLLANGTPEADAHALEHDAQVVLDAHIRRLGSLIESKNQTVRVHLRDLEEFKQDVAERKHRHPPKRASRLLGRFEEARPQSQKREGQSLQSLPMTGDTLADHRLQCEKGGGPKVGCMTGDTLTDHRLRREKGRASKVGCMTDDSGRPQAPKREG